MLYTRRKAIFNALKMASTRFVNGMQPNCRCDEQRRGPALRASETQRKRHTCRAESDQRTSRANVQELSQRETLGVGVQPRKDHAHPHDGRCERQEERKPCGSIVAWWLPENRSPANAKCPSEGQERPRHKMVKTLTHFWASETHPANFLKDSSGNGEKNTHVKPIRCVNGRNQDLQ